MLGDDLEENACRTTRRPVASLPLANRVGQEVVDNELDTRNLMLVCFFITIGLNARFADLMAGGRVC